MGKYDFSIQSLQNLSKTSDYIILHRGKGKDEDTSVFLDKIEFSYLEGIIWNKYREFGSRLKKKILASDCKRIITGFEEALEDIALYKQGDNLKEVLKFEMINPNHPLSDIEDQMNLIEELIRNLLIWFNGAMEEEKYITLIIK